MVSELKEQSADTADVPALTFKGKPFGHWINVTKTERSTDMLCSALRAGAELAKTKEEKAQLLEVSRTLARKHGAATVADDSTPEKYHYALTTAMRAFDPPEVIQFMLDELEHGTDQSVAFCASLMVHHRYDLDKQRADAWYELLRNALVEQTPQVMRLLVKRLKDGETLSAITFLEKLQSRLVNMRSNGFGRRSGKRLDSSMVSAVIEQNNEIAPTLRKLFVDSSPATKLKLIQLTQAFCPDDEEAEQALQADLFNPSTTPDTRDKIFSTLGNALKTKQSTALFLKKLLDNQLGPEEHRVKFLQLDQVVLNDRLRGRIDLAAQENAVAMEKGMARKKYRNQQPRTFSGRSAVIFHLLYPLEAITRASVPTAGQEVEPVVVKQILKQILAIRDTEDPNLKATAEELEALVVFKNAAWLLGQIEKRSE